MNVKVTLLMTMTWAARMAFAAGEESPAEVTPLGFKSAGDDEAGSDLSFATRDWRPLFRCKAAMPNSGCKVLCLASREWQFARQAAVGHYRPQSANRQLS